jgi:hypothetical protein
LDGYHHHHHHHHHHAACKVLLTGIILAPKFARRHERRREDDRCSEERDTITGWGRQLATQAYEMGVTMLAEDPTAALGFLVPKNTTHAAKLASMHFSKELYGDVSAYAPTIFWLPTVRKHNAEERRNTTGCSLAC